MDEGDEYRLNEERVKKEESLKIGPKDGGRKKETHRCGGKKVKQFTQTAILSPEQSESHLSKPGGGIMQHSAELAATNTH